MKNFSTWMILMLAVVFWIFRVVVAVTASMAFDFMVAPIDLNVEILLLFVTLISFILIVKRKVLGAILYLATYGLYFGVDLWNHIWLLIDGAVLSLEQYTSLFFSLVGMILPIAVLFDMLLDKNRLNHPKDKKTDWFYTNEAYDRQLDERADKNKYRTL